MKKIFLSILCLILNFFIFSSVHASYEKVQNTYDTFFSDIQKNYSLEDQARILKKVQDISKTYISSKTQTIPRSYIEYLIRLNYEAKYDVWLQLELSQSSQKSIELMQRISLQKQLDEKKPSSGVTELISKGIRDYIATSDNREFIQDGEIYRLDYSQYFLIEKSSISGLKGKTGIIVHESGQDRFIENYSFQRKIPYSEIATSFAGFFTPNHKIIQKHGNFYAYNFTNFRFFEDAYGVYEQQLESSGFDADTTFIYRDENGRYNFIQDYQGHGIIPANAIYGVPEKNVFLDALRDDSKYPTNNIGNILSEIQKITQSITQGKNEEEKIAAIYNWILENISYTLQVDLEDLEIFSAIETFENKQGVCTGYAKLMLYMLSYAGIDDVEVIRGHVIDAQDFPDVGHAWVRIGNNYYDPTFDDPIGLSQTKSQDQYIYFGLPKDIFYANRFEYGELPEVFKTASDSQIYEHIYTSLQMLLPKYEGQLERYKVFSPIIFRDTYNIGMHETLTPDILAEKIGAFTVKDNSFRFDQGGQIKRISYIRYYVLNTQNTQDILETLNYNIENLSLFNWQVSDTYSEWRLAYELQLQ